MTVPKVQSHVIAPRAPGRSYRFLEGIEQHSHHMSTALEKFDYHVTHRIATTDDELRDAFKAVHQGIEEAPGPCIVHLIGHGDQYHNSLHFMPPSGITSTYTNLNTLVINCHNAAAPDRHQPRLLILDLCHATSASDEMQHKQHHKVWIATAAAADEGTYNGLFTAAFARTLHRAADDPTEPAFGDGEFIDMNHLSLEVNHELETLRAQNQTPETDPQFLGRWTSRGKNDQLFTRQPAPTPSPTSIAPRPAHPDLARFIDLRYLFDRAGRHFTGRATILRQLGTWVHQPASDHNAHLISGGPGSGKSSIIAALALAWHPQITHSHTHGAASQSLRQRLPTECHSDVPGPVAVADASHKRTSDLIPLLVAQLAAQTGATPPASDNPGDFLEWVADLPEAPLIVIDSIDQAVNTEGMGKILLRPLLGHRRHGQPLCRMLLGTRETDHLTDLIPPNTTPTVHNLDHADPAELQADLQNYINERLTNSPHHLAHTLARELVAREGPTDCGAFLIATLYVTHLERHGAPADHEALRQQLPRTLVDLFVMQMSTGDDPSRAHQRHAALTALAHSKGNGMPATVANTLTRTMFDPDPEAVLPGLLHHDEDIKLYLRYGVDSDGDPLYTLFHQSLADHLRHTAPPQHPSITQTLWDSVDNWNDAPPYLKRHLADHASDDGLLSHLLLDPDYLPHADPRRLLPLLRKTFPERAATIAAAYRAGAAYHRNETSSTRRTPRIALDHLRAGISTPLVSRTPTTWWPSWSAGNGLHPALLDTYLMLGTPIATTKTLRLGGRTVVVAVATRGAVYIWDWRSGTKLNTLPLDLPAPLVCAHILDTEPHPVLTLATQAGTLHTLDLESGTHLTARPVITGRDIHDVTTLIHRGRLLTAAATAHGLQIWDPATATLHSKQPHDLSHQRTMTAVTHTHNRGDNYLLATDTDGDTWIWHCDWLTYPIDRWRRPHTQPHTLHSRDLHTHHLTLTGSTDATIRLWDTNRKIPLTPDLTGPTSRITALTSGNLNGRIVLAAAEADGFIWLWELGLHTTPRDLYYGHNDHISELDITTIDGQPILLSSSHDGTVRAWDLTTEPPPQSTHSPHINTVACGQTRQDTLVVSATDSSDLHLRHLTDGTPARPIHLPNPDGLNTISVGRVDGESVIITGGDDGTLRLWNLDHLTDSQYEQLRVSPTFTADDHHSRITHSAIATVDDTPVACTIGANGEALLWDLRQQRRHDDHTRRNIYTVMPHPTALQSFAWNGTLTLALADATGHCVLAGFAAHGFSENQAWHLPAGITAMAGFPCGEELAIACAGDDKKVRLWNTVDSQWDTVSGHDGTIQCIASGRWADRPVFATGDDEGQVRIWDALSGQRYDTIRLPVSVSSLAFGPHTELIIGAGREVIVLNMRTDKE